MVRHTGGDDRWAAATTAVDRDLAEVVAAARPTKLLPATLARKPRRAREAWGTSVGLPVAVEVAAAKAALAEAMMHSAAALAVTRWALKASSRLVMRAQRLRLRLAEWVLLLGPPTPIALEEMSEIQRDLRWATRRAALRAQWGDQSLLLEPAGKLRLPLQRRPGRPHLLRERKPRRNRSSPER